MAAARREPQRTCIGCRQVAGKRALVRLVRRDHGAVAVEASGERLAGRGAYLCRERACWERALQGATISKALRMSPRPEVLEDVRRRLETLSVPGAEEA